jgi:hypothetical protein
VVYLGAYLQFLHHATRHLAHPSSVRWDTILYLNITHSNPHFLPAFNSIELPSDKHHHDIMEPILQGIVLSCNPWKGTAYSTRAYINSNIHRGENPQYTFP